MSVEEFAKTLGLPGLLVLVWYLLEIQRGRRAEKADEAKNKIEERKIDALTVGFQTLSGKIDTHQRDEFEHHATTREAIVGLHTSFANQFDLTPPPREPPELPRAKPSRNTPARGTEYFQRPRTKGGGHDQG